ncbi:MAG: hypothetical protein ACT4N2_13175 [Hyphomicrobium sp.]
MIISLAGAEIAPAYAQAPITRADYDACQASDDQTIREAIAGITRRALKLGLAGVDYRAIVDDEWRRQGLDRVIDRQVDLTVDEVADETSLGSLVKSITDSEKAKELATTVAERVYRSETVKQSIEALATGVGSEVGKRIELASTDAAEPTLRCLKAFLGPRYGTTVAAAVAGDAGAEFGLDPNRGEASVSQGAVLKQSTQGLTGAALVIMRRQLANMAARIGQRVVGSVLARLVSVVAGGIGLVLIAKDIWELRRGVLPIIAEEMKAPATKDKVREELATALAQQIGEHVEEIGTKSAERVVEIWNEYRQAHTRVLDLAQRRPEFRSFLDTVSADKLPRLDEVTALLLLAEGEQGLLSRLENGTLDEAVKVLPAAAMEIARDLRSLDPAMQWSAMAGDRLPAVVANELHRRSSPDQFTAASLQRLLAIGDRLAIMRLGALDRSARDILFERQPEELKQLALAHSEPQLTALARYLAELPKEPRDRLLGAVVDDAAVMKVLASDRVRGGILASRDPGAAVDIMLRPQSDVSAITGDVVAAWEGRVSPILLWEKHPLVVLGFGFALLLVLFIFRRLLAPRRRSEPLDATSA